MPSRGLSSGWPGLAAAVLWASCTALASPGQAQESPRAVVTAPKSPALPFELITPDKREAVRKVVEGPTLSAYGPVEVFRGSPVLYDWLLDHPDRGCLAWQRLGAKCSQITPRGGGKFSWSDGQGSSVAWETVFNGPTLRVWYAEGGFKPEPLLPLMHVRAVVVLRHAEGLDALGRTVLRHQARFFLYTESRVAKMLARMLGPSAPRVAEDGVGQLELFFSGLVYYLNKHPERAKALLGEEDGPQPRESAQQPDDPDAATAADGTFR